MMDVDLATIRDVATTVAAILGSIKILQELRQNKSALGLVSEESARCTGKGNLPNPL